MVVLRCKMSKGGPNSGISIAFGSPLVNHYKDVLICCIGLICKTTCLERLSVILFYCQILVARIKCYVMLCYARQRRTCTLHVPRSSTKFGNCSFSIAGHTCMEQPPRPRQNASSLQDTFKSKLKTHLFKESHNCH